LSEIDLSGLFRKPGEIWIESSGLVTRVIAMAVPSPSGVHLSSRLYWNEKYQDWVHYEFATVYWFWMAGQKADELRALAALQTL
jgi:hypothetical protein